MKGATTSDIDTAWGFPSSASDSGLNTFSGNNCTMGIGSSFIYNSSYSDTRGAGGFITCALRTNTTVPATKGDMLFCGNLTSGTSWNGTATDFELIVPTTYGAGTETYYFYVNLG